MTQLHDNQQAGRFEIEEGGETVFATYRRTADKLIIDYVEAPPALRGSGAAGRLMTEMVAYAREKKLQIVPRCGYATAWFKRHPEAADVLN